MGKTNIPEPNSIGARDAPGAYTYQLGIIPPAIKKDSFEIKSDFILMVQRRQFEGSPTENPYDHLREFERICNLTKIKGVSDDALKLRLFPFSLSGKASHWETQLPANSITTWEECKHAFLAKFFSPARTTRLRNNISGFNQTHSETFSDAWERFKYLLHLFPHHRFTNEELLCIFYRGMQHKHRITLDAASKGSFMNQSIEIGWELVENLAASEGHFDDYDDHESIVQDELQEITTQLDNLSSSQVSQHPNQIAEACSVHQNQVVTPPTSPNEDMMAMLQCIIQGQASLTQDLSSIKTDFKKDLHDSKNEMKQQINLLTSRLQTLEANHNLNPLRAIDQNDSPYTNEYAAEAISLRSGRNLPPRTPLLPITEDSNVQEGEDQSFSAPEEFEFPVQTPTEPEINLHPKEKRVTFSDPLITERSKTPFPRSYQGSQEKHPKAISPPDNPQPFIPPPYKPYTPFPNRFKKM